MSGPIGVALIVWLTLLCVLTVWLARGPRLHGRAVRAVSTRVDAIGSWLLTRLGMPASAVLSLVFGLGLAALMGLGSAVLLDDVLDDDDLARVDRPAAHWLAAHREPWVTSALLVVTRLGDPAWQTFWVTAVCLLAVWRSRSLLPAAVGAFGGVGIGLLIFTAKRVVGRQRPQSESHVIAADGFSFPSGHAAGAAAVGIVCAWVLCRWVVHRWAAQVAVWGVALGAISLIGFSRPYLGVHYVTDVLAGWLVGAAWAGAVIALASWWPLAHRLSLWRDRHG